MDLQNFQHEILNVAFISVMIMIQSDIMKIDIFWGPVDNH